jgi:hypothetical protein
VHLLLAGSIGYVALPEARLGSTYVEILTDPPQSTYVDFASTQGEIPVDRQLVLRIFELLTFEPCNYLILSNLYLIFLSYQVTVTCHGHKPRPVTCYVT